MTTLIALVVAVPVFALLMLAIHLRCDCGQWKVGKRACREGCVGR